MELEQQAAAHHVTQRTVGLLPLPRLAELRRESPPAGGWILCDQLPNKRDVFRCNDPATILTIEGHLTTVWQNPKWNASTFLGVLSRVHRPPRRGSFRIGIAGGDQ